MKSNLIYRGLSSFLLFFALLFSTNSFSLPLSVVGEPIISISLDGSCGSLVVNGTLSDENGAPILYQDVELRVDGLNNSTVATTDENGEFEHVWFLPEGHYKVSAQFNETPSYDPTYIASETDLIPATVSISVSETQHTFLPSQLSDLYPRVECSPLDSNDVTSPLFRGIVHVLIDQKHLFNLDFTPQNEPSVKLSQLQDYLPEGKHNLTFFIPATPLRAAATLSFPIQIVDNINIDFDAKPSFRSLQRGFSITGHASNNLNEPLANLEVSLHALSLDPSRPSDYNQKNIPNAQFPTIGTGKTDNNGDFQFFFSPNNSSIYGFPLEPRPQHRFAFTKDARRPNQNSFEKLLKNPNFRQIPLDSPYAPENQSKWQRFQTIFSNKPIPIALKISAGDNRDSTSKTVLYPPFTEEKILLSILFILSVSLFIYIFINFSKTSFSQYLRGIFTYIKSRFPSWHTPEIKQDAFEKVEPSSYAGDIIAKMQFLPTKNSGPVVAIALRFLDAETKNQLAKLNGKIEIRNIINTLDNEKTEVFPIDSLKIIESHRIIPTKFDGRQLLNINLLGFMTSEILLDEALKKRLDRGPRGAIFDEENAQLALPYDVELTSVASRIRQVYQQLIESHPNTRNFWGRRTLSEVEASVASSFFADDIDDDSAQAQVEDIRRRARRWLQGKQEKVQPHELLEVITKIVEDATYSGQLYHEQVFYAFEKLTKKLHYIMKILVVGILLATLTSAFFSPKTAFAQLQPKLSEASSRDDFSLNSDTWNGASKFRKLINSNRIQLVYSDTLDWGKLSNRDILFFVYPRQPIDEASFSDFVVDGGQAVIVDDFGKSTSALKKLSITRTLDDPLPHSTFFRSDKGFPILHSHGVHPLIKNVYSIVANYPSVLHNSGEPIISYEKGGGLVYDMSYGKGRVVVISDPSMLINNMIDLLDNAQLFKNTVNYLCNKEPRCQIHYFAKGFNQEGSYVESSSIRNLPDQINNKIKEIQNNLHLVSFLPWLSLILLIATIFYLFAVTPIGSTLPLSRAVIHAIRYAKPPQSEFDWNVKTYGMEKKTENFSTPMLLLKSSFERALFGNSGLAITIDKGSTPSVSDVIEKYDTFLSRKDTIGEREYRKEALIKLLNRFQTLGPSPPLLENITRDDFLATAALVKIVLEPISN